MNSFRKSFVRFAFVCAFTASLARAQDISVVKTGQLVRSQGGDAIYNVTIANIGVAAANGVSLTDPIPAGMTFVGQIQLTGPAFSCAPLTSGFGGTVNCTIGTLNAGESASFRFTFNIPAETAEGTVFTNTATGAATPADANPGNDSSTVATTVVAPSDLAVTKSGPAVAPADSDVTFSVTITNHGPGPATDVTLSDPVPAMMTFVSATQTPGAPLFSCATPAIGGTGTVSCTTTTMLAGDSATFTFVFHIQAETPAGTTFTNIATGNSPDLDPNDENDSGVAVTTTPPPPSSDMGIAKTGPATAGPSSNVTFDISVSNSGPDAASNVSWQDTLPGDLEFVSLTRTSGPAMNCTTPAVGAGGTINCTSASFPSLTTATFALTTHVPAAAVSGTVYDNTATVSTTNADPNSENDSATASVTISAVDLSITKSGPGTAMAGTNVTYTIGVTNAGPDAAATVIWSDPIPAGTTFVSVTQTAGPAASCSNPGGTVMCILGLLPAATTATFDLVLNTGSAVTINNTATVTSDSFDTNASNNSATATTNVTQSADLAIAKTGPANATAGTNVTYTVSLTNNGPSNSMNVTLTDNAPANTTFVSVTQNSGPAFNCTTSTCTIAALNVGQTASFTFVFHVSPSATGSIMNTATASATTADPSASSSSVTTFINQSADLAVTKSGPASVTAGTPITYTVTATNGGPSDASNVTLTDNAPANTTFVSVTQTSGPAFACTASTCTIASFAAGASATFEYVFAIDAGASGSIANTATISSATTDPAPANNSAGTTAGIGTSADLAVTKTGPASATSGTSVTYTVTATNNGPSAASNVSLSDNAPANTTFTSVAQTSGPAFTCATSTCTIASFAAGASATFEYVFAIDGAATGSISNTATVNAATPDPTPANNSATATTPLTQTADLSIVKTGPAAVTAGSNITYTVTAANAGPSSAANVTITDNAPANTTFVSVTQTSGPTFTCTASTCTIASFASGASATFQYVFAVDAGATGSISNTASISSATADPTPANSSSNSAALIDPGPTDVAIAKSVAAAMPVQGGNATYTIVVTNNGPGTAAGVTVTDALPAGMTLISATSTQGTCSGTTTVTCNAGILAPGANATITLAVKLPQTAGPISNTATVTAANAETAPANNSSTATFDIAAAIPTLSELGLLLMVLAIAAFGLRRP